MVTQLGQGGEEKEGVPVWKLLPGSSALKGLITSQHSGPRVKLPTHEQTQTVSSLEPKRPPMVILVWGPSHMSVAHHEKLFTSLIQGSAGAHTPGHRC